MPEEGTEHFTEDELQRFYSQICGVIERTTTDTEEMVDLIDSLELFRQDWLDTYGATSTLWILPEDAEVADERKNIKVSEETYSLLVRLQGFMQTKTGEHVTMGEVVEEAGQCYRSMHSNEIPSPNRD